MNVNLIGVTCELAPVTSIGHFCLKNVHFL